MAELTGSVVIDVNHALAWKTLIFDVEIVAIKKWKDNTEQTVEENDHIDVH